MSTHVYDIVNKPIKEVIHLIIMHDTTNEMDDIIIKIMDTHAFILCRLRYAHGIVI